MPLLPRHHSFIRLQNTESDGMFHPIDSGHPGNTSSKVEKQQGATPLSTVRLVRGGFLESTHRVSAAVVNSRGDLLHYTGDPYLFTSLRSSAKPFQVMPLIEDGVHENFGFTPEEIAIMAGSHAGEEFHVNAVASVLEKIGLSHGALKCGRHRPFNRDVARRLGNNYGTLHNNCSGKHAAMLAMATHHGWTTHDYYLPDHPVQQRILDSVAMICGLPRDDIGVGIDGCGVPVFFMPLFNMALGFARFCDDGYDGAALYRPIRKAMVAHPLMVAGTGRMDTDMMNAVNGEAMSIMEVAGETTTEPGRSANVSDFISKIGAEGLPCAGWRTRDPDRGVGVVLKIGDGGNRAEAPAFAEALHLLGVLDDDGGAILEKYAHPEIRNFRKEVIGHIEAKIIFQDRKRTNTNKI